MDEAQGEAIKRTIFNVYSLITLYLHEPEIGALGDLICTDSVGDEEFSDLAEEVGVQTAYRFYLTGALGVGKSTTLNQFRNLTALDEWLEERPEVLLRPWKELDADEREQADVWITAQFARKNNTLRHEKIGVFMIDRPPLDPLAFTEPTKRNEKAERLLKAMSPGDATREVQPGTVILLSGDPNELAVRMLLTDRDRHTVTELEQMQADLHDIYGPDVVPGTVVLDTNSLSIPDVTRRVAEIIHLDPYVPCNLHGRLEHHRDVKATPAVPNTDESLPSDLREDGESESPNRQHVIGGSHDTERK